MMNHSDSKHLRDDDVPFDPTPEALRQRFASRDPNWNRRPAHMEPREQARARIESRSWQK